jgi:hypothetical protein
MAAILLKSPRATIPAFLTAKVKKFGIVAFLQDSSAIRAARVRTREKEKKLEEVV